MKKGKYTTKAYIILPSDVGMVEIERALRTRFRSVEVNYTRDGGTYIIDCEELLDK